MYLFTSLITDKADTDKLHTYTSHRLFAQRLTLSRNRPLWNWKYSKNNKEANTSVSNDRSYFLM